MASSANFSILADVQLNTKGIQQQLNQAWKAQGNASGSADALTLSYQAANAIFRESVEVITDVVGQVYELDSAITELKKVSDLSGKSLDDYVSKLSKMGQSVARTGKPWCLSRNVQMVNVH